MVEPSISLILRPIEETDRPWVQAILTERWGSVRVVSRGRLHQVDELPGLIALSDESKVGLLTYSIAGEACEVVTLDSQLQGVGVGTCLIEEVEAIARQAGCSRLWLVTTNDNLPAIAFYKEQGFVLKAIHKGAVSQARAMKPEIPLIGHAGIPIEDEWEFERKL